MMRRLPGVRDDEMYLYDLSHKSPAELARLAEQVDALGALYFSDIHEAVVLAEEAKQPETGADLAIRLEAEARAYDPKKARADRRARDMEAEADRLSREIHRVPLNILRVTSPAAVGPLWDMAARAVGYEGAGK